MKDPTEPFKFAFPDINGKMLSNTDERFRGKVVIVSISGSWCPNCHDEAPFLVELYKKYRAKGLEIVALSFEEEAQKAKGYPRLLAFNKRYGVDYPVVLAGEQADLAEKVPQIHNLNSFPTTIFLGRDGLVRGVHAGFRRRGERRVPRHREGRDHRNRRAFARGIDDDDALAAVATVAEAPECRRRPDSCYTEGSDSCHVLCRLWAYRAFLTRSS